MVTWHKWYMTWRLWSNLMLTQVQCCFTISGRIRTALLLEADGFCLFRGYIMIGKRKRRTRRIVRSEEARSLVIAQTQDRDIFRQYFESQFEPLQEAFTQADESSQIPHNLGASSDTASLSDWDGLSEEDSTPGVEIIEHGREKVTTSIDDAQHARQFMVGL